MCRWTLLLLPALTGCPATWTVEWNCWSRWMTRIVAASLSTHSRSIFKTTQIPGKCNQTVPIAESFRRMRHCGRSKRCTTEPAKPRGPVKSAVVVSSPIAPKRINRAGSTSSPEERSNALLRRRAGHRPFGGRITAQPTTTGSRPADILLRQDNERSHPRSWQPRYALVPARYR